MASQEKTGKIGKLKIFSKIWMRRQRKTDDF